MTATLERSLSRASSMSIPVSSPLLSVHHDLTPPAMSDPGMLHLHDRITFLDSRISELRSTVLTRDGYIDRRNREDDYIRREFVAQRTITERIDVNVTLLKTDVNQLKSGVSKLKYDLGSLGTDTAFLRTDVDRLQNNVQQVQAELEALQTEVGGCRTEIKQLHTAVNLFRSELMTLQDTSRRLNNAAQRFSVMESRMAQMERVRFNSLANTIHAPINPVPKIDEDGTLRYPDYFPTTVWRFWCLKKRSRARRLVELAEFYELEGFEYWGRNHREDLTSYDDSDSSDSSDRPNNLTRSEATYQYPEACHQALAATLGLNYYKIRKEAGEGPNAHITRPAKRYPDETALSNHSAGKPKPEKRARRPGDVPPTVLERLITGVPSIVSKSVSSEHEDKLAWRAPGGGSEISDETMFKLKGILSGEVGAILRAIERGRLHVRSEHMDISPTESKREEAVKADDAMSAYTVPTEILSPSEKLLETTSP
ncbi:hypothetical protein BGW36DRAFT_381312 [Talaromyces proteolyticus]|uniref:Uncharacterized protein n=1 Tax=Talaromyces proteolyticus TaxID=1131652 RepID=A0AAD4PZQ4_9EURO|nr:uncharacterized protein BGW36DRAFT_381312 [Talaromyces proteolyticus]KAH8696607.1 hypothetical protein BGW36DRAFT_381312 [Talaromyces proteolyticus]